MTPRNSQSGSSWIEFLRELPERQFCEWASPYLAILRRPLSVLGMAGITSLLCGLFVAPQGYVIFGAIATVMALGCAWPWIGLRGIDCRLRFLAVRTEEGKPVDVEIEITNRWPWPVWGLAIEGGFDKFNGDSAEGEPAVAVARIGGWSRTQLRWPFAPEVRGRYPLEQPRITTEFPFGLWKAEKSVDVLTRLVVWPQRFRLPPLLLPCGKQSWSGQTSGSASGRFGQRSSVREYSRGDSMRQIHWAKTALYDKLVSYDREGYAVTEAVVLLDTHPSLHRGSGPEASVEWAVRIAASVCDALMQQQIEVTILAHAGRFGPTSAGSSTALLDWLAVLRTDQAQQSPNEKVGRVQSGFLSIHITTSRSPAISGDSIVLSVESDSMGNGATPRGSWMTIAKSGDVATQVRSGWQRSPRSTGRRRHAV